MYVQQLLCVCTAAVICMYSMHAEIKNREERYCLYNQDFEPIHAMSHHHTYYVASSYIERYCWYKQDFELCLYTHTQMCILGLCTERERERETERCRVTHMRICMYACMCMYVCVCMCA